MSWTVLVSRGFWASLAKLRQKYGRQEYVEIVSAVRDALEELGEKGSVSIAGWDEHALRHAPFDSEGYYEFHLHDGDVLVVYFKCSAKRVIRMVGVYDHAGIPNS